MGVGAIWRARGQLGGGRGGFGNCIWVVLSKKHLRAMPCLAPANAYLCMQCSSVFVMVGLEAMYRALQDAFCNTAVFICTQTDHALGDVQS